MITLTYNFITNPRTETNPIQIFWTATTIVRNHPELLSTGMLTLFGMTWLIGGVLLNHNWRAWAITLGGSLLIWLSFTGLHTFLLTNIALQRLANNDVATTMPIYINLLTAFSGWVLITLLFLAGTLVDRRSGAASTGVNRWVVAGLAFVGILVIALFTNLQPIQADMFHKIVLSLSARRDWANAIILERSAIGFAPYEDQYYLTLGRAQVSQAQLITTRTERLNKLKIAARVLLGAQRLNPLSPDHAANLAQVNRLSVAVADQPEAATFTQAANDYYNQATTLAPNNVEYWNSWARLNLNTQHDYAAGLQHIQTSLAADAQFADTYVLLGDYWALVGNNESNDTVKTSDYEKALINYQKAFELNPNLALSTQLSIGQVEIGLRRFDDSIATFNSIVERAPNASDVYIVYTFIAKAYAGKGDKVKALENAYLAYYAAPENKKADMQALIDRLK